MTLADPSPPRPAGCNGRKRVPGAAFEPTAAITSSSSEVSTTIAAPTRALLFSSADARVPWSRIATASRKP